MNYFKVSLYCNELLSLPEKKKYIDSMYNGEATYTKDKKKKLGFISKFNNSIGFKDVVDRLDNFNCIIPAKVKSPKDYISPEDLLLNSIQTPVVSFDILNFYIPNMKVSHPNIKYSYKTKIIVYKWVEFLRKIFPQLELSIENINHIPEQSLKEFTLEYFYRHISKNVNYTIEFSSAKLLSKEDINYILPKIQALTNDQITIDQYECSACKEHSNGKKPYHIEIEYITWYGKQKSEDELRIYM